MKTACCIAFAVLLACPASAQSESSPADPMAPLAFLVGEWEGEGWMLYGPDQRHTFVQQETVEAKLGGDVLLIEGMGRASEDTSRVVHHAFALLAYDPASEQYVMQAFRAGGPGGAQPVEAEASVEGGALVWGFTDPRAGQIRYTIREDEQGRWHEVGKISRDDGATWFQFFEMTLARSE